MLKLEFYAASEYVVWEGDISTDMYFIAEGILDVRTYVDPCSTASLKSGTFETFAMHCQQWLLLRDVSRGAYMCCHLLVFMASVC
jgi:hypothetical protein